MFIFLLRSAFSGLYFPPKRKSQDFFHRVVPVCVKETAPGFPTGEPSGGGQWVPRPSQKDSWSASQHFCCFSSLFFTQALSPRRWSEEPFQGRSPTSPVQPSPAPRSLF